MKVCIIGAGPAGIYVGKYLHKNKIDFEIFEKEALPYGLKRTSFSPELRKKDGFCDLQDLKITYNREIKPSEMNNLNCDLYVIATGGIERKLDIPGKEFATPSSKIVTSYPEIHGDICIIGMGNVAFDLIRNLKGYKSIIAIGRNAIYNSKFSNAQLVEVVSKGVKIFCSFLDKICFAFRWLFPRIIKRRYNLLKGAKPGNIELHFNTYPIKITKSGNKFLLQTNTFKREYDRIISAIGYKKQDLKVYSNVEKPIIPVGWSKLGSGTLTDVYYDSMKTAESIVRNK